MSLPKPEFVSEDAAQIVLDMVAAYEAAAGRTIQPADIERLVINMFAYREQLIRTAINDAARRNLVAFARFPELDYLGQLVGVTRLAPEPAVTTMQFVLTPGHTGVTIPLGLRVASSDGKVVFATLEEVVVAAGVTPVDVDAECQTVGDAGNSFAIGAISTILDPQAWLVSASNLTETGGGSDEETDEALRERIKLAPASFSNAGSSGAYEYWARTAHPSIIDVAVISPFPGEVAIYPLVEGGIETPAPILSAVLAACNDERIRPLTDSVTAISPTPIATDIEVDLTLLEGAVEVEVTDAVDAALSALVLEKQAALGRDLTLTEIVAACMGVEGVYDVDVTAPLANVPAGPTEFVNVDTVTVNVAGTSEG